MSNIIVAENSLYLIHISPGNPLETGPNVLLTQSQLAPTAQNRTRRAEMNGQDA